LDLANPDISRVDDTPNSEALGMKAGFTYGKMGIIGETWVPPRIV
jgi:hypothetical protein